MSDQMDRDIDEIMKRLGEPASRQGAWERVVRLVRDWTGGLRTVASRMPRVSARQVKLASVALVVLVGAGLFLGLVYPGALLAGGGSGDGEDRHGSVAEQASEGAGIGGILQDDSDDEALGEGAEESWEEEHHEPDEHEEGDRGRGEDHH